MWQNSLLPFQLFTQSMMVASGMFLIVNLLISFPAGLHALLLTLFPASIAINLLLTLAGKFNSFASEVAMLAHREMTHGRFRNQYWWGGITLGHIIPLVLFFVFRTFALPATVACTLVGLFFYEYAFVMAPQYIPNS